MVSKWRIRTIVIPLFIKTTTGWGGGWLGYCGKYIGLIFGQDLVNGWVNFHFLSGTSLTQNIWLYYAGSRDLVWYREQYSSRREHTTQDEWMSKVNSLLYLQGKKVIVVFFASQRSTLAYSHTTVWKLNCDHMKIEISQHLRYSKLFFIWLALSIFLNIFLGTSGFLCVQNVHNIYLITVLEGLHRYVLGETGAIVGCGPLF